MVPRILVVDDDAYIRELVVTLLRGEGYAVCEAADGREALGVLHEERVDLCVLDLMMPNMDGYEFCERARRYYDNLPILMLTAKGEIRQKVKGFNLGADDYLTKPFEPEELSVRIRALLKRCQIAASSAVEIGRLRVDKESFTVSLDGSARDIPKKEFELLFLLGSYPGKTLTRDRLIEEVWGLDFEGNERTLDVHVNRLRDRFASESVKFRIVTVRGLGYRLEVME